MILITSIYSELNKNNCRRKTINNTKDMHTRVTRMCTHTVKDLIDENFKKLPGGVPQHNLRSSICSASNPMNHEPKETSSLAYLCSTCLGDYHSKRTSQDR